jgi:hypothetical protein
MLTRKLFQMSAGCVFLGLATAAHGAAGAPDSKHVQGTGSHGLVPSSVAAEHKELHAQLDKVIKAGGQTAAEGRNVEKLLRPHFVKEEQFALPPLAVLVDLASGRTPPNAQEIIKMSDVLQKDMPAMLAEHETIGKALERLRAAAQEEHKQEAARFADHLKAHAKQEEEILYPAAILAGRYLKLTQR